MVSPRHSVANSIDHKSNLATINEEFPQHRFLNPHGLRLRQLLRTSLLHVPVPRGSLQQKCCSQYDGLPWHVADCKSTDYQVAFFMVMDYKLNVLKQCHYYGPDVAIH